MNAAPVLLGYAAAVGFVAPRLLLRSSLSHRAPALAAVAWHALAVSFAVAATLAAYSLAMPAEHLHAGVVGILQSCGVGGSGPGRPDPSRADFLAVGLSSGLVLALLASFAFHSVRARRARDRHRDVLDLVGRRSTRLSATVLPYHFPAAYCLPGRRPRVVVSDAAVRGLSPRQLDAVLEHERAHIAGRHHLVLAAMEAFHSVFRWVPLARHAREQTALLLEMVADDWALRTHSDEVLASAMYEMAAARVPRGAFAAGGQTAVIRVKRMLAPRKKPRPVTWASLAAAAAIVPVLPFLVACTPGHG